MNRLSVLFLLLSLVIGYVNSGDNSAAGSSSNQLKHRVNTPHIHQIHPQKGHNATFNRPVAPSIPATPSASDSSVGDVGATDVQRDKRGTTATGGSFQLDDSEIARQNQITQQIFANYLERRLFPHRSANQKIPTIAEILPKAAASTTPRPRPRGFSSASEYRDFRRGTNGGGRKRNGTGSRSHNKRGSTPPSQQLLNDADYADADADATDDAAVTDDGQESLQSVESEQHDQYYGDVFNRDPSENEIDSGKLD